MEEAETNSSNNTSSNSSNCCCSNDCGALLDNIRRQAFVRALNLRVFFKPFDPLNHGEVSLSQFHRALDVAGIRLTASAAAAASQAYTSQETKAVNYKQFCSDIEKVFRVADLEKDPYIRPLAPGEVLRPLPEVYLQPEEAELADKALQQLRLLIKTRGIDLRAAFAPFDKHGGKIPPSAFFRAFPVSFRENKFTEEEIHQLARLLTTTDGLVDCRKLCQLVQGPVADPPASPEALGAPIASRGAPTVSLEDPNASLGDRSASLEGPRATLQNPSISLLGAPNASLGSPNASQERRGFTETTVVSAKQTKRSWARDKRSVLQKIETGVNANQLPLRESFRDFDGLRKGVCTPQQAQAALLSALRLPLGKKDWESLMQQFVRYDGMFEYDKLCKQIEYKLGNPEAQQYPNRVVPMQTPSELRLAQEDKTTMTEEECRKLNAVQDRLAFQVKQTRKILLPTFQDFDKQRTQHVTRRQLWRILGMLGLPVTEEELDVLCLWLCDKGNLQEVAYRPLLAALDPPANEDEETTQQGVESVYYKNGKVVPLSEILRRSCK